MASSNESFKIIMVLLAICLMIPPPTPNAQAPSSKCQRMCGNISILYPWGLTADCSLSRSFTLNCSETLTPSELYFRASNVQILNISLVGELTVRLFPARSCYNESGQNTTSGTTWATLGRFRASPTRNKFVATGCDTIGLINSKNSVATGCLSVCDSADSVTNGTCSGVGCCQTAIPKGVLNYNVSISSFNNHTRVLGFNPCSYAFLAEESSFNFSSAYLGRLERLLRFPVVLDWDIGNQRRNVSASICSSHSDCKDSDNGDGYHCICKQGFQGNPYLPEGCKDINECQDSSLRNNCQEQYCTNTIGNFTCGCPDGYHGSGSEELGCTKQSNLMIILIVGIGAGLIALVMCGYCMYMVSKKRKLIELTSSSLFSLYENKEELVELRIELKRCDGQVTDRRTQTDDSKDLQATQILAETELKHKFFRQNGGLMLQQQITTHEGYSETAKIYTKEELEKATNMYDEARVIGRGDYGTVFKGILRPDNNAVAIKKSKLVDNSQIEQFINEVVVLSQINHRNVVKLLGCCLETEVPLLVYEFVSHGTLYEHIHEQVSPMSWDTRLRIAAETAGVLAYLHSSATIPIIHRDVKSTNILLDENLTAKVADFGASRLVPLDQAELSTMVQGTLRYLDPEYLLTSNLTEKSDVYSFGVVLVELLTGRKPLSFDMPEKQRCLANFFLTSLKGDDLFSILEDVVSKEASPEQVKEVANIAKLCLKVKGDDRPTMKEIAMELEGVRAMTMGKLKHAWAALNDNAAHLEEAEGLLGDHIDDSSAYDFGNATP